MTSKAQKDRDKRARHFGHEADAINLMPCIVAGHEMAGDCIYRVAIVDHEEHHVSDPSHVKTVATGGGPCDLVPKCNKHHAEMHTIGVNSFGAKYGLSLRAKSDEYAVGHARPLGILGLADRWAWWHSLDMRQCATNGELDDELDRIGPAELILQAHELDTLLGWVRRRMDDEVDARCDLRLGTPSRPSCRPGDDWDGLDDDDRGALSFAVGCDLAGAFQDQDPDSDGGESLTMALCGLAGGWS